MLALLLPIALLAPQRYRRADTPADKLMREADPAQLRLLDQYTYFDAQPTAGAPLELSVLVDAASPWATSAAGRDRLVEELGKTSDILARCGVEVRSVNVAEASLSDGLRDDLRAETAARASGSPYDAPAEVRLMAALSDPVRPLVLMLDDAYTHAYNRSAVDQLTRMHPEASALLDVASVSWKIAVDYQSRFHTQPSFSLLAHELAHVLGDLDHVNTPQPNLMNGYEGPTPEAGGRAKSGDLFPWQCEAIRRYAR